MGLGYLSLGQRLSTLSGGERQRLKLASSLAEEGRLYVFDEPTSGLHRSDVDRLLTIFDDLTQRGATVIVTAGSDEKCAACLALGAHHAINYKTQDFVAEARRLTDGRGVDVVLDMVAGSYVAREVECLAEDGRVVIIAVQGGLDAQFNAGLVLRRRLTITGSTLRPRPVAFKAAIARSLRQTVWPWIESGRLKPVVDTVYGAAAAEGHLTTGAAQAHALMESGQHMGKIVLDWSKA